MSKLAYTKPTATKMGTVTEKTEGGLQWVITEVLGKRGAVGN